MEMLNINAFFQIWNAENSEAEFFSVLCLSPMRHSTGTHKIFAEKRHRWDRGRVLMLEGPNV